MKLITKIPVAYNSGLVSTATGVVEGHLYGCSQQLRFDFESSFMYEYKTVDGTTLASKPLNLTKEEINGLYELVKSQIPTGLSYTDATTHLYYLGMKLKMAETFGIEVADIDIVE